MKKFVLISSLLIFILSSLIHSLYEIIPLTIFPVNESIWEHNKMIILSFFIFAILYKIIKKEKNIFFSTIISTIICIILVNIIFTPIYLYILEKEDNIFITLTIYLICIMISQYINYKLLQIKENNKREFISFIMFPVLIIIMIYLTYFPLPYAIFYDYSQNCTGLCT